MGRRQLYREMKAELDQLIQLVENGEGRRALAKDTIWCSGCGTTHPRWR